jgi:CHAT domain-containing protein
LLLCQERMPHPGGALVIGVADARIPAVAEEIDAVADTLATRHVMRDGAATRDRVMRDAAGRGVVHLATHGLFRADNPLFSALKLADGWLTAADLARLDLSGATVTLSACETGRAQAGAGDEVLGLTHAILGAGARTLMVSLWLAHDRSTADLMKAYYRTSAGDGSRAHALRLAQLEIKSRLAHPYYWAPFVQMGAIT